MALLVMPRCVLHEDEHFLIVHKPAGVNTHAPSPYAGEGIYEWLKHREPRWGNLAIVHRLDKATSGVMVFAKTPLANRSLNAQFTERKVHKTYELLTECTIPEADFTVETGMVRVGERYVARGNENIAVTQFRHRGSAGKFQRFDASPLTGRTHQIRVHAQSKGISIVGDDLYGGPPFPRVCLHARELGFLHPASGKLVMFSTESRFMDDPSLVLREWLLEPGLTDAYRLLHGEADRAGGFYVDRWGENLLCESEQEVPAELLARVRGSSPAPKSIYRKKLNRQVRRAALDEASPELLEGSPAPESFPVRENGVSYEISFAQGYSVGLFLDQRDNRRRLLKNHVGAGFELFPGGLAGRELLNTFSYTCGFSVCAAMAGARTTSLDLSRKYLDWGRRNFALNGINTGSHDFIYGDVFEWALRLKKKERQFDLILLDPPTFSHAKGGPVFQAEKHFGRLVTAVLPLLKSGGVLFSSCNAHMLSPEAFLDQVRQAIARGGRRIAQTQYVPQPLDFPVTRDEPGYLKTVWMRVT